jgi:hypothetical protein
LIYIRPCAGGLLTNAGTYAKFLRKILSAQCGQLIRSAWIEGVAR